MQYDFLEIKDFRNNHQNIFKEGPGKTNGLDLLEQGRLTCAGKTPATFDRNARTVLSRQTPFTSAVSVAKTKEQLSDGVSLVARTHTSKKIASQPRIYSMWGSESGG